MDTLSTSGRKACRYTARAATRALGLAGAAMLVLVVASCNGSTDPIGGEEDVVLSFQPAQQGQQITLAEQITFAVTAAGADTAQVNWRRDGVIISNAMEYTYVPGRIGTDTLRVQAAAEGVARNYYWVIDVSSTGSTLPPEVPGVAAGPGPGPGDVAVTWSRVSASTYPLNEYVIAVSFTGPISGANWDQARELRHVTHRVSQVGYQAVFTEVDDGMIPGAEAWFAVRALDELGQMSPVGLNGFTNITTGWWLNGTVRDDTDAVLPGVVVSTLEPNLSTNTDLNGDFRIGPLRSIDRVVIRTTSGNENIFGWYDFTSTELDSVSGRDLDVRLIKRHQMDTACELYEYQFLNYLRHMSLTRYDPLDLDSARLWRWPQLPLRIYVPDVVVNGLDFGGSVRFAMAFWDSVMGEPIFVETSDPESAQLVCRILDDPNLTVYGRVDLLEPGGNGYELGDVIPEKMSVYISTEILIENQIKVVALHELGHTLGLYNHTACSNSDYLMVDGPSGNLGVPEPIHPNEQAAVRCLSRLPQGVDMRQFSLLK